MYPAPQTQDTLARRRRWEHPRDTLRLQSVLGEGHFGQVSLGALVASFYVTGGSDLGGLVMTARIISP